jgi:hypothetical protein
MRIANMRKPTMPSTGLPEHLPHGTHYVIEGRRNKDGGVRIVSRQVILPNGEHFDVAGPGTDRSRAPRCAPSRRHRG